MNYNQLLINKMTLRDFYSLSIEDQGRIQKTITAVCKSHFLAGDSISVAMRKTMKETHFQKRVVETIVRASAEIVELVNKKHKVTRRFRQSNLGTVWMLNVVS